MRFPFSGTRRLMLPGKKEALDVNERRVFLGVTFKAKMIRIDFFLIKTSCTRNERSLTIELSGDANFVYNFV